MATAQGLANAAARRVRILDKIRASIERDGYPPTANELAQSEDVHRSMIQMDLRAMADAGVIDLDPGVVRGIRLAGYRIVLVPLEGVRS